MAETVGSLYRIRVQLERREDGGLRAWSDDLPELVLSHRNGATLLRDVPLAIAEIMSERLGNAVKVSELVSLSSAERAGQPDAPISSREFAAGAEA